MIRYAHTNIIARDWRALAAFYEQALGCTALSPERDLDAPWLARATGVSGAHLRGVHLRLPGHGARGPTLEIFSYSDNIEQAAKPAANRTGLRHLAFEVDDVEQTQARVLALGGHTLGEIITSDIAGAGSITFVYLTDPEGNIIELQSWAPPS